MLIFCAFVIATSIILPGVASFMNLRIHAVGGNADKSPTLIKEYIFPLFDGFLFLFIHLQYINFT
jgi:hypothetical protein